MGVLVSCENTRAMRGVPESVGDARAWAVRCLPPSCPIGDDVALVVSELATNAVIHSASGRVPSGTFVLVVEVGRDVESGGDCVEITVTDEGPAPVPAVRGPGEGGHGLQLVRELADAYDVVIEPDRRTVWCRLDWPRSRPHNGPLTSTNA